MTENRTKSGFFERIAEGYFYGSGNEHYLSHRFDEELTKQQLKSVRSVKLQALSLSAIAGMLGVILLYLPPHWFPEFFTLWTFPLNLWGSTFEIPLFSTLYGLVLAVAEIYFLVFINIRAVHRLAIVCGFPPKEDPEYDMHIRSLVNIGVEKNAKNELSIGLNPWQGYKRYHLILLFVWNKVKASLSNILFKMIIRRVLGRYALRIWVDLAGIPVMAIWNAIAANNVFEHAKVRILAPSVIQYSLLYLQNKHKDEASFRHLSYDILQFLAIKKRSFHENHYLLSINLLRTFNIDPKQEHELGDDFYEKIKGLHPEVKEDIARLLLIGIIIDGSLSFQEKRSIRDMQEHGIFPYSMEEVKLCMQEFVSGKGIGMLKNKLGMQFVS
ncbi:MAG: hypothetical protein K1X56_12320 [Flavobacteriales bacterium]|nr:hypothetical protein [Flavobacteriales bacterium]